MRKAGGWLVACALVAAGCTPGDGPRTDDDGGGAGTSDLPAQEAPRADGTTIGSDDLTLPGLVDTSAEPIPDDGSVRTGTLDNGLRYYVRENDHPGGKAELRLAVRAGSVDEFGPSTGVAHFLEHMLFNGTDEFPENELIDTLRSFGAAFGADVNASTGYESTVYELSVPNRDEAVELGLSVLEQWLSHATIAEDQVAAERGVVLDEWRVRTQSVFGRQFPRTEAMFLGGTPFEGRSPIGTDDSISAMTADELRAFYDRWYRPDNVAVVVVGDIDVDEMVAAIERRFGGAAPRDDRDPSREPFEFPIDLDPDAFVHLDPEQQTTDIEVTFPIPAEDGTTTAGVRAVVLDLIAQDALLRRLDDDVSAGTAPFDDATYGDNSLVGALDASGIYLVGDAERSGDALRALLDEFERARRFGFTELEIDTARESLRSVVRSRYEGRNSTQDAEFADAYVDHFVAGIGYPSAETEFELLTAILDAVTVDAVEQRFRTVLANSAPHVVVTAPQADAGLVPTVRRIRAEVTATVERELSPRDAGRELPDAIVPRPRPVEPSLVERVVEDGDVLFDPVRLVYPNGVTVILNANDIVEGQIVVGAASRGGLSLVADDDVVDGLYAADVVMGSGVGDLNDAELGRLLAGADVGIDAYLTPYTERMDGQVATADLEIALQLVHGWMTSPRVDQISFDGVVSTYQPTVDDPSLDADLASFDALLDARYPGELRYAALPTPEQFATLDADGVERVWRERFGNADGWVFVFSGDLDIEDATDLMSAYLGTLPSSGAETPVDVEDPPPDEIVRTDVVAGTGETATVVLQYTVPVDEVTADLRVAADVATELMSARLTDVVRERLGDSYSPYAVSYVVVDPDPIVETYVYVTGAPDRVASIADLVVAEFRDLAKVGASDREFENAYAQVDERYGFVDNWQFVTELLDDAVEPALDLEDYLDRDAALDRLGPTDVRRFIERFAPADRYIQVVTTPA